MKKRFLLFFAGLPLSGTVCENQREAVSAQKGKPEAPTASKYRTPSGRDTNQERAPKSSTQPVGNPAPIALPTNNRM